MEVTIKTKYSIGDEVWFVKDSKIHCATIHSLSVVYSRNNKEAQASVAYALRKSGNLFDSMNERDLYDSKEVLIASMEV